MSTNVRLPPRDFRAGELAPWMDGVANELTASGCRTLLNFLPLPSGAAMRRPGSFYAGTVSCVADSGQLLIPIEIDSSNIYVLEVGDVYIRFWIQSTHAPVGGVGAEYEVTSPWSVGELSALRWAYVPKEKALYFAHSLYAMRKLTFASAASWSLTIADLWTNPPWILAHDSKKLTVLIDGFADTPEYITSNILPNQGANFFHGTYNGRVYVGLAQVATGSGTHIVSADGRTWVQVLPTDSYSIDLTDHDRVFATDNQGRIMLPYTGGDLYSSEDDGVTWTTVTPTTGNPEVVGYSSDNGTWRIVVIGQSPGTLTSSYSEDGYTWTSVTETAVFSGTSAGGLIAHNQLWVMWTYDAGPTLGEIATASTGSAAQIFSATYTGVAVNDVAYGEPGGTPYWIACLVNSTVLGSSDAITWTTVASPGVAFDQLAWTGTRFIAIEAAASGTIWWSSDDSGATWTSHTDTFWGTLGTETMNTLVRPGPLPNQPVFGISGTHPSVIAVHEGRLVIGASVDEPATLWASATGRYEHFYLGETAAAAWEYELAGERNVDIQWIMGGPELVVGTRTEEIVLRGEQGIGITPISAQGLPQSTFGSKAIKPVRVHDRIIFAQRGGEVLRAYAPAAGTNAWRSDDITRWADHIATGGVTQLVHQDDPHTYIYAVRSDGQVPVCLYEDGQATWARIVSDGASGTIEQLAVVPTSGQEDEIWWIAKRTINGSTTRYLEYLDVQTVASKEDAHFVDSGVETTSGTTFSTISGLDHLEGETVHVLVDGNEVTTATVSSGSADISPYSGTQTHAGLPFISRLQTNRAVIDRGAGVRKSVKDFLVWVHETIGGEYGPDVSVTETVSYTSGSTLTTDALDVAFPMQTDNDGYLWAIQQDPLPMTVIAMAAEFVLGDDA